MKKRLFDCETIKLLHTHTITFIDISGNYYGSNYYSPAKNEERKKQIFLVHNVSNSTAFSNSFYKKKMKKKLEKDNKMNIYSLPMMNKVASTTI